MIKYNKRKIEKIAVVVLLFKKGFSGNVAVRSIYRVFMSGKGVYKLMRGPIQQQ